ncbi:hypothetical protein VN97_g2541 [Penicillium thymicola]|uniref:Uncharacterized protein n=1 Tax=Penicillium thymicola TaxID=293382 RepID=A0AAI9TPY6_PENTH|nr:hypothetical protein VN97_g2541 [Penicillium thymicola]
MSRPQESPQSPQPNPTHHGLGFGPFIRAHWWSILRSTSPTPLSCVSYNENQKMKLDPDEQALLCTREYDLSSRLDSNQANIWSSPSPFSIPILREPLRATKYATDTSLSHWFILPGSILDPLSLHKTNLGIL